MMKTHGLEPYIEDHPFFAGLDPDTLTLIADCGKNVKYDQDEFLFKLHDNADEFFIIREGRVALEISAPGAGIRRIQSMEAGDVIGWSWLFPPYAWQFDARALELTRAISLNGNCLRGKCEADHELGYELMKRFSKLVVDRLEATRLQLLDVYGSAPTV